MSRALLLAGLGIGLALLAAAVVRLVRLPDRRLIAAAPLGPERAVSIAEAGRVQLHLAGPRLSRAFRDLEFSLVDPRSGAEVPARPVRLPIRLSAWRETSMALLEFRVERPGDYVIRARGPGLEAHAGTHRVELREPFLLELAGHVIAIIALAGLSLAALVKLILGSGPGGGAAPVALIAAVAALSGGGCAGRPVLEAPCECPAGPACLSWSARGRGNEVFENPVRVEVRDRAGAAVATEGARGSLALHEGTKARITLYPDGVGRMKGYGKFVAAPGLAATVTFTPAAGASVEAECRSNRE